MKRKTLLWVDDNPYQIRPYVLALNDVGYEVIIAESPGEAKRLFSNNEDIQFAILDVMIPLREGDNEDPFETAMGHDTGVALGRWLRRQRPDVRFVGFSVRLDREWKEWFERYGAGSATKLEMRNVSNFVAFIRDTFELENKEKPGPRMFIVHGHDEAALYQLKNYLQNTLDLGEPIILREQPSLGRTIIEKFEEEAELIDLVFVLLTPDDSVEQSQPSDNSQRRARQNVVFELGYFFAKLQRRRGRVIVLYKGDLELPSDISGLVYVNISEGIEAAGEEIRRELRALGFRG
jgi:predicted nucleotide-binding protein